VGAAKTHSKSCAIRIALKCNTFDTKGQYTRASIAVMIASSPWYCEGERFGATGPI
jgi:hypothetical protein